MEEVGQTMGLSKSWVCRLHARGIDMLRDLLRSAAPPVAKETTARPVR
jgi:DNA-directed RNA polymerase specialized sigma subunit